jgi:NAD(P)-dependent dehydrogenase (short-subunit alcohol dehydrogenase family)
MHVAVFGASGKIGRLVTQQLLSAGHEVTVLVRSPDKLMIDHPGLTVRIGQLSDAAAVAAVAPGGEAVISALGPSLKRGARGMPVTAGTRAIVAAMRASGVRRFIGLATPSVPDPRDGPNFRAKLLPLIAGVAFPNAFRELRGMTAVVSDSELDWTLARITNPTDRPAKGTVRAGYLGRDPVGWAMTRADIAAFLVAQLSDTTYLMAAPAVSN